MSSNSKTFKTWDQYVTEAKIEPFEIPTGKEAERIVVENPTGARLLRISGGLRTGDLELVLASLCGDAWEQVQALMDTAPHGVLPELTEDMMSHFDLYEDVTLIGPGGGKVTARRPREIQGLINRGYRPVGEGEASRG